MGPILFPQWLAVLWVILGFALGGSFVAAVSQPDQRPHISAANPGSDASGNQHQPTKALGERLSIIWARTWEDPVAFYTFVLGIFTFCLVAVSVGQGYFLFRADRTTRISAEAAALSAKAAIGIELPIIRALLNDIDHLDSPIPDHGPYGSSDLVGAPTRYSGLSHIEFKNSGRTPAFPIKIELGWRALKTPPEIPRYDWKTILVSHAAVIMPDKPTFTIRIHATIELSDEQQAAIRPGQPISGSTDRFTSWIL